MFLLTVLGLNRSYYSLGSILNLKKKKFSNFLLMVQFYGLNFGSVVIVQDKKLAFRYKRVQGKEGKRHFKGWMGRTLTAPFMFIK